LKIDFSKDFSKLYNIEINVVLNELKEIIKKKLNKESIFFKRNRLYESFINKNGIYTEKKIRLTKKLINQIKDELKERLIYLSLKQEKKVILDKFKERVVEGEIIGETKFSYIIKIVDCKFKAVLYKNKKYSHNIWHIGEKGLFYIYKVSLKKNELIIILNDYHSNIEKFRIIQLSDGIYIKKIKFLKNKVIIKSIPKIDKKLRKKIALLLNKKILTK
jgi:hypothetical protein